MDDVQKARKKEVEFTSKMHQEIEDAVAEGMEMGGNFSFRNLSRIQKFQKVSKNEEHFFINLLFLFSPSA